MKPWLPRVTVSMLLVTGCATEPASISPSPVVDDQGVRVLASANAAADELGQALRRRLLEAMAHGGAEEAAEVCAQEARTLTLQIAERHQVRVGRHSLRMRGAAPAPAWVQAWVETQGERGAAGAVGIAEVDGGHARVLRPIAVEGPCLTCHGENISAEVDAILRRLYPEDHATGYRLGDLRGALWAEVGEDL